MLENAQNKMIDSTEAKTKEFSDVTVKAVSASVNEYFFPGHPDFQPATVRATSLEEAEQLWKTLRKPVVKEAEEKDSTNE